MKLPMRADKKALAVNTLKFIQLTADQSIAPSVALCAKSPGIRRWDSASHASTIGRSRRSLYRQHRPEADAGKCAKHLIVDNEYQSRDEGEDERTDEDPNHA